MNPLVVYLIAINIYAFLLAVWDKNQAKRGKWRISESSLMLAAVLGGGVGLMAAFLTVRHKTKKRKFMLGVPAIILLETVALLMIIYKNKA